MSNHELTLLVDGIGPDGGNSPQSEGADAVHSDALGPDSKVSAGRKKKKRQPPKDGKLEWVLAYNLELKDLEGWLDDKFSNNYGLPDYDTDDREEVDNSQVTMPKRHYRIVLPQNLTDEEREEVERLRKHEVNAKNNKQYVSEDEDEDEDNIKDKGPPISISDTAPSEESAIPPGLPHHDATTQAPGSNTEDPEN